MPPIVPITVTTLGTRRVKPSAYFMLIANTISKTAAAAR
jgi:hypothetical protein